jgi:hypothetical protein
VQPALAIAPAAAILDVALTLGFGAYSLAYSLLPQARPVLS